MSAQEKIQIAIDLLNGDRAVEFFKTIDKYANSLSGRKIKLGLQDELRRTKESIQDLNRQKIFGNKSGKEIADINQQLRTSNQRVRELQQAIRNLNTQSFGQIQRKVASFTKQLGGSILTFGNTLSNITSIGSRITSGLFMGLGYKVIGLAQEGLASALSRSDTMKTYEPLIKAMGEDPYKQLQIFMPKSSTIDRTKKTATALEQLNDAVLGLPTGLNEILDAQKNYYVAMGDFEKATGVAIAANNAWIANATSADSINVGQRMLRTLASTGELNKKQWDSLRKAMPATFKEVEEYLKRTGTALDATKAKANEFFDALIYVGTRGKTADAVEVMKETLNSVISNWKNAFSRLGTNVITALSETLQKTRGQNIYQFLNGFKDAIDKVSVAIQNWIRSNPQKINEWIDRIKSIDWMGLLRGAAEGLQHIADVVTTLLKGFGKINTKTIGKFLVAGSIWGKIITIIGGFVKGSSPVFGLAGASVWKVFKRFLSGAGDTAEVATEVAEKAKTGTSALQTIAGYSEEVATTATTATTAASTMPATSKVASALASFKTFALGIGKFALGLGAVVATGGAIAAVVKAIKVVVQDAKVIAETASEVDWQTFANVALTFATSMILVGKAGTMIAGAAPSIMIGVGAISAIAIAIGGVTALSTWFFKKSVNNTLDAINGIGKILESMKGIKNTVGSISDADLESLAKVKDVFAKLREIILGIGESFYIGTTSNELGNLLNNSNIKKLKKIMNNLDEVFKSMANIAKRIKKIEVPTGFSLSRIKDFTTAVTDTVNALADGLRDAFYDLNAGTGASKDIKKIMSNVSEVFNTLSGIVSTIDGFYKNLEKLFHIDETYNRRTAANGYGSKEWNGKQFDEWTYTSIIDYTRENIHRLAVMIKSTFDALIETFNGDDAMMIDEYATGILTVMGQETLKGKSKEYGSLGSLLQKVNDAFTALGGIVTTIDGFYANLENLVGKKTVNDGGHKTTKMSKVSDYIRRFVKDLATLFEDINSAFSDERLVSTMNAFGGLDTQAVGTTSTMKGYAKSTAGILGKMNEAFNAINGIITAINGFSDSLYTLVHHTDIDTTRSPLDMAREYVAKLARNLSVMFAEINAAFEGTDGSVAESQFASIDKSFESIKSIVDSINSLEGKLPADGTVAPIVTAIRNNITALATLFNEEVNGATFATQMDVVSVALHDFATALTDFAGLAIENGAFTVITTGLQNILTAAQNLTTYLGRYGMEWGKAIVNGFKSANVPDKIAMIITSIIGRVSGVALGFRFYSIGYSLGQQIVMGVQSATSSINISPHVTVAGNYTGLGIKGALHLAKGGSIFRRRGTDTVPAMLTPGEYVMRKRAVSTFGTDFMRRVNALDIKGAMASLMMRGGGSVLSGSRSSVVNNTVNRTNNARVTINNNNSSQNFTYRRANRWVGAL